MPVSGTRRGREPAEGYQAKLRVPCCVLGVRTVGQSLSAIDFLPPSEDELAPSDSLAERACIQLLAYFDDPGRGFELPLAPRGTAFQQRVWQQIRSILPGRTRRYGEIATALDSAARAVGQACGENPWPLVVPCHRVVAAHGLGGFAHRGEGFQPGVKRWLLLHEAIER